MSQVLPGDITGLYYITVSNLPWSCTWQVLKDFAKNQDDQGNCLAIEHVRVYPLSTAGWVSVRGKKDFIKALRHLERGILGNRALIVDGRNEKLPIHVRDLQTPSISRQLNEGTSNRDIIPTTREASITTSVTVNFKNDTGMTKFRQTHSIEIPYNTPILPEISAPLAPGTSVFVPPLLPYVTTHASIFASTPSLLNIQTPTEQFQMVTIERRKVIITQISQHTSTSDLKQFIHGSMIEKFRGNWCVEDPLLALQSMRIERHPGRKQKSHAFLVFEAYITAKAVVDMLDGVQFGGRNLSAKLAKEGAGPQERSAASETMPSQLGFVPAAFLPIGEIRPQPQLQVPSQDPKSSKPRSSHEIKAGRLNDMERAAEGREGGRVRASFKYSTAAMAAAAKTMENPPRSPMVVNGSSPGKNF